MLGSFDAEIKIFRLTLAAPTGDASGRAFSNRLVTLCVANFVALGNLQLSGTTSSCVGTRKILGPWLGF